MGAGDPQSINRLVELIGGPVTYIPKRPGEPDVTWADVTKIREALGWEPRIPFDEGVRRMMAEIGAWYEKQVVIPESWRGQRITLFLERPHIQTEVQVDGHAFGTQNSLSTPHVYDLTAALTPGPHRITICVDNTYRIDVGHDATA